MRRRGFIELIANWILKARKEEEKERYSDLKLSNIGRSFRIAKN